MKKLEKRECAKEFSRPVQNVEETFIFPVFPTQSRLFSLFFTERATWSFTVYTAKVRLFPLNKKNEGKKVWFEFQTERVRLRSVFSSSKNKARKDLEMGHF